MTKVPTDASPATRELSVKVYLSENGRSATASRTITCRYCATEFTVRDYVEDLPLYLACCASCYEDDAPGMARFERMTMMGAAWAIEPRRRGPIVSDLPLAEAPDMTLKCRETPASPGEYRVWLEDAVGDRVYLGWVRLLGGRRGWSAEPSYDRVMIALRSTRAAAMRALQRHHEGKKVRL